MYVTNPYLTALNSLCTYMYIFLETRQPMFEVLLTLLHRVTLIVKALLITLRFSKN